MNSFDQEASDALQPRKFPERRREPIPADPDEGAPLVELGRELKSRGYRFTTITPASHARVLDRPLLGKASLRDIFGWSCSFSAEGFPEELLTCMIKARVLARDVRGFRSTVRCSTLGEQLFLHSAFPTTEPDAVFFGPDTYRFARFIEQSLLSLRGTKPNLTILDLGAGSGAGGLHTAKLMCSMRPSVTLSDINRRAIFFSKINAELNQSEAKAVQSDLFENLAGPFDLIISNPPYLADPLARQYRHGGGEFGSSLSLRIVEESLGRLAPRGRLLLYTGSPIVNGADLFHEALSVRLSGRDVRMRYDEIDPDVFGEELGSAPYDRADRIAAVGVTIDNCCGSPSWSKQ